MTKLMVDLEELSTYGKNMGENAQTFDAITGQMVSIVESLRTGWKGNDANTFVTNASAYLANLAQVREALVNVSQVIQKHTQSYANRINDFYSKLGG